MQNSFFDRLMLIMSYLEISSLRGLAKQLGISFSKLQSYQRGSAPGLDVLNNILVNMPNISAEWLITGNGEMLKGTDKSSKEDPEKTGIAEYLMEQNSKLIDQLKVKDQQLNDMLQTYNRLLEREKGGGVAHQGNDAKCVDAG